LRLRSNWYRVMAGKAH